MLAMFIIIDKSLAGNCFWGVFKRQEIAETDRLNVVSLLSTIAASRIPY